ncbi:MAG: ZIP family metal transporter, partial [Proteobacteria bacterium]|nr:ZIP family metal transporter [Pseudomonadota bacterium]
MASILAAAVTTLGIYVIRRHEVWGRNNIAYFSAFAAGVLIAVSFLHIIPTSFTMNRHAPIYLLAGYLMMYSFNRFISTYVCDKPERKEYAIGLVPMIGIGFHSFIDGVIYSITFNVSIFTGTL